MGECIYCSFSGIITYGSYQCSDSMHNDNPKDFCLYHAQLHIELHPSHKDSMTEKQTLKIFGGKEPTVFSNSLSHNKKVFGGIHDK